MSEPEETRVYPHQLPPRWYPTGETLAKLETEGYPARILDTEILRFTDYWLSNGKRKVNWDAAFRNWVRKLPPTLPPAPPKQGAPVTDEALQVLAELRK